MVDASTTGWFPKVLGNWRWRVCVFGGGVVGCGGQGKDKGGLGRRRLLPPFLNKTLPLKQRKGCAQTQTHDSVRAYLLGAGVGHGAAQAGEPEHVLDVGRHLDGGETALFVVVWVWVRCDERDRTHDDDDDNNEQGTHACTHRLTSQEMG